MSILKSLEFSNIEAPKNTRGKMSTVDRARGKFLQTLDTQLNAVNAYIDGQSSYTVSKNRYVTGEDGERKRVAKDVEVRPLWFEQDGQFFITLRYANKPLELSKGKPTITAGSTLEAVRDVLTQVRDAVEAGELDKVLENAATEARKRMTKN